MVGRLPIDEQLEILQETLSCNEILTEVLTRTPQLDIPNWYVTAGCLVQTVWNVVTGRPPTHGIRDYDLFYHDDSDLSYDAEDAVIKVGSDVFDDLEVLVEIRNQARVHLWYEKRFGVPAVPLGSTEAGIDAFLMTTCCLGVRVESGGRWRVYAPHGLADIFNLVVRPNPVIQCPSVYYSKVQRWRGEWPELTVMPWLSSDSSLNRSGILTAGY